MRRVLVVLSMFLLVSIYLSALDDNTSQVIMHMQQNLPEKALWVANGMEDTVSIIDLDTGTVSATIGAGTNPHILSASPDGSMLYVINAGQHDREPGAHGVGVVETDLDEESNHHPSPEPLTRSEEKTEQNEADSSASANSLWVYDTSSGTVVARIPVGMGPTHAIPSADGKWVYVTNTDGDSVSVVDTGSWAVSETITNLPEPHDGELSEDDSMLFLATAGDNTLSVVRTDTREIIRKYPVGQKPRGVAAGGVDGNTVYLTNKGDGTISVIDIASDGSVATISVGDGAHALRTSPDGTLVYVALSKENAVAVFDISSGQVTAKIRVGELPEQIDLSPDGRLLFASNFNDSSVTIIDTMERKIIETVPVGTGAYGLQSVIRRPTQFAGLSKNHLGFAQIDAVALEEALGSKEFTLINVHVPYVGDIPRTDLNIQFDRIAEYADKLPALDQPIVIYCRSGSMSRVAGEQLAKLGFTNIVELKGGFTAWRRAGYPMVE